MELLSSLSRLLTPFPPQLLPFSLPHSRSLFAPPSSGPKSLIADTERVEVSWCTKSGYGTRLIPPGTVTSAQFLKTDTFVQIIGNGDLTKINVFPKDQGGELDPHGADGNGNPIGK